MDTSCTLLLGIVDQTAFADAMKAAHDCRLDEAH